MTNELLAKELNMPQFPRSAKYDPKWMIENDMGPSSVWLAEFLAEKMDFKPGMRVLDLGCGRAMSSIFLAREFGLQVWAADLWIRPGDNWQRIKEAGLEDQVFPLHADAYRLPFAPEFFDCIVSLDSYQYYGTNDMFLKNYLASLVKRGGQLGIVVPGLTKEFETEVPEQLKPWWDSDWYSYHSPAWWQQLWQRSGVVDIEAADNMPQGWEVWLKWEKTAKGSGYWQRNGDIQLLEADGGEYLNFTRVVARRK